MVGGRKERKRGKKGMKEGSKVKGGEQEKEY